MYSKFLLLLTTLVLATTLWTSCDDEPQTCNDCGDPWWYSDVGSIQIVFGVPNDTLNFLPGLSIHNCNGNRH
ncbi:MAG: hypothetical protein IPP40_18015 [bacterium]|nr:hypothetical protein [bacterium]